MPGNPSNNESFTEDDESNLAYMFAQDVRLFIKYLCERCAQDPDNRVKYRWSDKRLEQVRNLYNSVSFHRRLCDYLGPQKGKAVLQNREKIPRISPSVVDEYVGERYPERSSLRRGRSALRGQGTGARTRNAVGKNPYPRVQEASQPTSSSTMVMAASCPDRTEERLYSSELLENSQYPSSSDLLAVHSYNPEQFLTVPEPVCGYGDTQQPNWTFTGDTRAVNEPVCGVEVTPPSPDQTYTRSPSFESGHSTPMQFPQFICSENSPVAHTYQTSGFSVANDQWLTSWNHGPEPSFIEYVESSKQTVERDGEVDYSIVGPRDRKRKRAHEETGDGLASGKKRRT